MVETEGSIAAAAPVDAGLLGLADWDNLLNSWRLAGLGKHGGAAVARFEYRLGESVLRLQRELLAQTWLPGPYVHFSIHEPKRRWISAAPFADRVVHHALCSVIRTRFERGFIAESFADRLSKGTHKAVDQAQAFARRHRHVLRMDVRQHFPSIDHAILLDLLWRRITEPGLRRIVSAIVASGADIHADQVAPEFFDGDDLLALCRPRGLPIGNLTSQFWSNCYLDPLDHFVKTELGCTAYLRYVDDFALFDDDKARLNAWGAEVKGFLARRLRLRVHENSAQVLPCRCGIPWLGFVVFPDHRRVKSRKVVAATRRLSQRYDAWCAGEISFADFDASVQGWINHVRFADSWGLRESVLDRFPLQGRPFSLAGKQNSR
jgi:hypothetical protein